jgi:hypothetical protein
LLLAPLTAGNMQFGDPSLFQAMAAEMQRNIQQAGWDGPSHGRSKPADHSLDLTT